MSETSSLALARGPFHGYASAAHPNAGGQTGVRLQAQTLPSVTQISSWISGVPALAQALTGLTGQPPPATVGLAQQTVLGLLLRTGPEEFLLVGDTAGAVTASLRQGIGADVGAVTDLSHARCRIRISGENCRDTLSKLFPIDLRETAFPLQQARATGHHHVPALLYRVARDQFDIYVFTTYAQDQLHVLEDAALEYGVSVEV